MTDTKAEPLLQAHSLSKRFGGLAAVSDVSLSLWRGSIHAVIGPNGAGKSTLTHLLSGDMPASSGSVHLAGHNITGWSAERISRQGLGRSYQKTNIFAPFTVWENVRLAAQSRRPRAWAWLASSSANGSRQASARATQELAERSLERAGLSAKRHQLAGAISHGEQRQLEIAMTLATKPHVILLDEPLAGMGAFEAARMVELLLAIKADHAMLLVEHDMDAVFAVADRLTVMVNGQVIASDTPERVRSDARVQAAYLGEEAMEDIGVSESRLAEAPLTSDKAIQQGFVVPELYVGAVQSAKHMP